MSTGPVDYIDHEGTRFVSLPDIETLLLSATANAIGHPQPVRAFVAVMNEGLRQAREDT